MSPTPSSNSKKRVQPKRSTTTTPSKSPKRSLPQRAKKNNSDSKNSNTTPKNSKSKTPTRSGGKRKQPFKVIVNRDSNSNSEKVKPSPLRSTRRYSRKDKTAVLPNKNFRVLIKKRVKVVSTSQQSLILDDICPDLDTTNINTPSPEGKVPVLKKDQSTIILDGIHEIDLEDLQKKQDESFSEMRSTLKNNTGLHDKDTMRSFRSFVKPNSTIMRSKSKIISPTKSFGPIPYDYKSKYDDDEDGNLYDAQAENKNDITICDLENDNKQDVPNLDIPPTDSEFSKIPDQEIPEPFAQESQPPQIDIENNQSFAELDQDLEFDIGDFTNIPDQSGFINPTEKASNIETSLNDNTLHNNTTPTLDQNVLDLDIGDLFSPSNNINVPETTNFDIISNAEPQVTNVVSEVSTNPLNFLLNAENSPNTEPKTSNSLTEVADAPVNSLTNTHLESENIESNLPTTNLFTATGFSAVSTQQEPHTSIDEPSNSDNSLSQSHNTSQVRKYFAISSDDEHESDIHEPCTARKRKQLLESDASEDEELKEDMDFLKDQDVYDSRTRDRKKLSKTALLLEKMKNRKFEFDEFDSNEESSNVEQEENHSNDSIKNTDNDVYTLQSESSESEDSIDNFIDKNEEINEEDKQELLDLSMDLSMQTFSIEDSFSILVKSLVYNCFDPSFLENIYSSRKQSSYYINAIKHVNRRIDSYKYSLIQSSVWNQRFMEHISIAPFCYSTKFGGEIVCQACKKDKHFSTFKLQLSGHKYDNETLQDNISKSIDETYYLGKFCFHRAQIYHQLHHFAYHLKRKVNSIVQHFNLVEGDEVERAFSKLESDGYVAKWYNEIELVIDSANKSYSTEKVK